jgi:phage baseplate assembly protein W
MAIPFALSPDGSVAMVSDPYDRAQQRIQAIVGTRPTERAMDVNFGIPLDSLVFEPDDDVVELELREMVEEALTVYEPGVVIEEVIAEQDQIGDGISSVKVEFSLTEDPISGESLFVNTATIRPGGTVKEIIRG